MVIEFDAYRAALVPDRQRFGERAVLFAQVVEDAQRLAGEIAEFGVVPLPFEFGDHDDREHNVVLRESKDRVWVRQHNGRIENIGKRRIHGLSLSKSFRSSTTGYRFDPCTVFGFFDRLTRRSSTTVT